MQGDTTVLPSPPTPRLLAEAERLCRRRRLQLTPGRRRVLEILLDRRRAMKAYDILDCLAEEGAGAQPPIVYRALRFLVHHGLVHRLESANAFVACRAPEARHEAAFTLCRRCGSVEEILLEPGTTGMVAPPGGAGFRVDATMIEMHGLCATCRHEDTPCPC
ncbi:transcriptional repressor [Halomonas sp. M4R1S46]|uniref:transcriptional repressor n=1 Tax=Halomonas sp. M4R1S46 TaxID=2982692 RepID=UPI0021E3EF21|nr:transcriptional repressor [Halomonas sp. M4R1S46]UYG09040.1 transcriptional repressor [Halomonas sp. M4R1S46]